MISILCHLYYHHLWEEISESISKIKCGSLYVNLVDDRANDGMILEIKRKFPNAKILVSSNQGRDIGGYLRLINLWMQDDSPGDLLIMCHSKNRDERWRRELLLPLFHNYVPMLFKCPTIGMVGHKNHILSRGHDVNAQFYNEYCRRFGFKDTHMLFIAGTIFCVCSSIFRDFFNKFNANDLANELEYGNTGEPSKTHAWERLFGAIAKQNHTIEPISLTRDIDIRFDERSYLANNPDVAKAVIAKVHPSGLMHYVTHGINEKRLVSGGVKLDKIIKFL